MPRFLRAILAAAVLLGPMPVLAQSDGVAAAGATLDATIAGPTISRDIFGQFVEHLGEGVYGGIWVGKDSAIPNVRGIRSDVVAALRAIRVPVVRWPGGCFADQYNWRHGIGPQSGRVSTVNMWGNVIEPNSFGTDEFLDFIDQINSEAYISVNVGSGSPAEAAAWLEYMTTDQPTTLGKQRAANGHPAPYRIKYLGLGNENWGCGGGMNADEYDSAMKRFGTFAKNLNPAQNGVVPFVKSPAAMRQIAVGPGDDKTDYTEAVMKAWKQKAPYSWDIDGISLHYYTGGKAGVLQSPSAGFGEDEYAASLRNTLRMDQLITANSAVMDRFDPERKISLAVDEWGIWTSPIPGTNFMFMRQHGSLRDGIVAALNFNIFARHAERVRMANIAQMANVIQSLILTDGPRMVLTPTYHVHRLYLPFQDAQRLEASFTAGIYRTGDITLPQVDGIAARGKDGKVWLAVTNLDAVRSVDLRADVKGVTASSAIGELLTAPAVDSGNTFDKPDLVTPQPVRYSAQGGRLMFRLPPHSVTVLRLQ